jgi:hypothetical protein
VTQPTLVPSGAGPVTLHCERHDVVSAHIRWPGQAAGVLGVQLPEPLHVPGSANWLVATLHVGAPQAPLEGYTHVPEPSHEVAPHAPPRHAAVQQFPLPTTSHTLLAQSAFDVQLCPAESKHAVPPAHV